eukprot:TRINITY_DN2796_c0_g2_i2.p1 TRINITY_DN2796_c0_g2~~TRINITY_DN2796_c0_g2_i2.p1  ORF type:complete len:2084 (-),score=489.97 TRINITY_DN2796_c0_g2_i2:54-6305(-)
MSNVVVAVRVRPMNDREKALGAKSIIEMQGKSTAIKNPADPASGLKSFAFDQSYWSFDDSNRDNFADQSKVFQDLGVSILDNAFQGFNCSIFAYGQTGAGKSYSMIGYGEDKGLIPRVSEEMFNRINKITSENSDVTFNVEVSFFEIYNELVFDLLNPGGNNAKKAALKVRNHPKLGPYVDGLAKVTVTSFGEIEELMDEGSKARTVASTNMNATSSRSHGVFTVLLTQRRGGESGTSIVSNIHMVDLAGSERASATGASGDRLREGSNINKSLSTLGKVISALAKRSEGKSGVFIPYRDSVLTWLLKESLGGNAKTIMLAAISPADVNYEETLSTLRYADSAKQIKNAAIVNEDPTQKLIRELQEEVERLRQLLSEKEAAIAAGAATASTNGAPAGAGSTAAESAPDDVFEIKTQLAENVRLMQDLGKSWDERRKDSEMLSRQRIQTLQQLGITPHAGDDARTPNLVNLNEDPILTGALVYYLYPGETPVGRFDGAAAVEAPTEGKHTKIQLLGLGVSSNHCVIVNNGPDNGVILEPREGGSNTFVNGQRLTSPKRLTHGDRVIIGNNHIFRFNDPEEAHRMLTSGAERDDVASAPFDYNSALAEKAAAEVDVLMANSVRFDITEEEERVLEKKMKEFYDSKTAQRDDVRHDLALLRRDFDKNMQELEEKKDVDAEELNKLKEDTRMAYERRRQELSAEEQILSLVLQKQQERFAGFAFRIMQEKTERQQLRERIMQTLVLIDEANAIAEELRKNISFELSLRSDPFNVNIPMDGPISAEYIEMQLDDPFGKHKRVRVGVRYTDKKSGRQFTVEDSSEFAEKLNDMRELYEQFVQGDKSVADGSEEQDFSPFYLPSRDEKTVGHAYMFLRDLLFVGISQRDVTIVDDQGRSKGTLHVEISRRAVEATPKRLMRKSRRRRANSLLDGTQTPPLTPTGPASPSTNGASSDSAPGDELLGTSMTLSIRIDKISGFAVDTVRDIHCRYKFWHYSEDIRTLPGTVSGEDSFSLSHDRQFVIDSVNDDFLNYLENEALVFEVRAAASATASPLRSSSSSELITPVKRAGMIRSSSSEALNKDKDIAADKVVDEFKLLATLTIQELEGTETKGEYKNVPVKDESGLSDNGVVFRLNRGRRAPRRVVLQFARLKHQSDIDIVGCDEVFVHHFKSADTSVPSSPLKDPASPSGPVPLKILRVDRDRIEAEWDWAAHEKELATLLPAQTRARGGSLRASKKAGAEADAPDSPQGDKDKDEPRLIADLSFKLRLNTLAQPLTVSKNLAMKLYTVARGLSRTESEKNVLTQLQLTDPQQGGMAGAHFSVSVRVTRELKQRVIAFIEEQQAYQRLTGLAIVKERLRQEVELVDRLKAADSTLVSRIRPRESILRVLEALRSKLNLRSAPQSVLASGETVSIKVQDISGRPEAKMSGYLQKKDGKAWKKRWFVLSRSHLYLYQTDSDENAKSSMDLTNATITEVPPAQYPFSFVVVNWQNAWFLQAADADEYRKWLEALEPTQALKKSMESAERKMKQQLENSQKQILEQQEQLKVLKRKTTEQQETIQAREEEIVQLRSEVDAAKKEVRAARVAAGIPPVTPRADSGLQSSESSLRLNLRAAENIRSEAMNGERSQSRPAVSTDKAVLQELNEAKENCKTLEKELRDLKIQLKLAEDRAQSSATAAVASEQPASDSVPRSSTRAPRVDAVMQIDLVDAQDKVKKLDKENKDLRSKLEEAEESLEKAEKRIGDLKHEVKILTKSAEKATDEVARASTRVGYSGLASRSSNEADILRRELADRDATLAETKKQLRDISLKSTVQQQTLEELERQTQSMKKQQVKLESELKEKSKELKAVESDVRQKEAEIKFLKDTSFRSESRSAGRRRLADEADDAVASADLKIQISKLQKLLDERDSYIIDLADKSAEGTLLDRANARIRNNQDRIATLEMEVDRLRLSVRDSKFPELAQAARAAEIAALKGEIEDKAKLNDDLREKNRKLVAELRDVRADLDKKDKAVFGANQDSSTAETRSRRSEVEANYEKSRRLEVEDSLKKYKKAAQEAEDRVWALEGTIRKLIIELEDFDPTVAQRFRE